MKYHLAELNIARFLLPQEDPVNADFINNLDRVNALAEEQQGFIWRFTGAGNNALDVSAFVDPNVVSNLSLWANAEVLSAFVYRNRAHREIMRRRREWFEHIEFYLVLWWVEAGHLPDLEEAKARLKLLASNGPTEQAFNFKSLFPPPGSR